MQTIHIWPANHLLLENHPKARAFRRQAPEGEMLVVFEDGILVEVEPPPDGEYKFRDTRYVQLIERAWARGLAASTKEGRTKAPKGWILWSEFQPGMLVYDGHNQHLIRLPSAIEHVEHNAYMGPGKPRETKRTLIDVIRLRSERTIELVDLFDSFKPGDNLYLKVVRQGLTQEQCLDIREMFKNGDYAVLSPTYVL